MEFIKKVTQRLLTARRMGRVLADHGLINTTDLLVATAGTVVLSAAIGGAAISTLNEAKYGKAQPDAGTIAQAITSFYKDTGKWPGQAEHTGSTTPVLLATGGYSAAALPKVAADGLQNAGIACANNSLEGFVSVSVDGYTSSPTSVAIVNGTDFDVLDLNDFLVRKPADEANYPSWKGPYLQEISGDPWQRAWVAYLTPLYCSENLTGTDSTGALGYAWLLSGGSNRTITTKATDFTLDPDGDDTGVILGKLRTKAAPVSN